MLPDMRVLIAPDKFKGTLTARQVAGAIARGWRRARPEDELVLLPMSDGGDGFGAVLAGLGQAARVRTPTVDAAGRRHVARWWWRAEERTAIVESAAVIGLALLPPGKFHPFELDSRGLAPVLRAVAKRGARRCVVGIGGSATNDGGFGLATGLGWRFFDDQGSGIRQWTELHRLARIEAPPKSVWPEKIIVAVDVQNRLLGRQGCTRVYGPQKGLRPADFSQAEACLRRLAAVVRKCMGRNMAIAAGAGAAGGLGFGLMAFAGAILEPGFELVARSMNFEAQLRWADLVITGEGQLDRSSLMGKGAGELARRCRRLRMPCIALAGNIAQRASVENRFALVAALTDLTSVAEARANAAQWLEKLAARAARDFRTDVR